MALCSYFYVEAETFLSFVIGKTHDKHVRHFFAKWVDNIGQIVPQKLPEHDPKRSKTSQEPFSPSPQSLHCYTCDLYFTSLAQLEQHKAGRNHQRLTVGLTAMKPGYYNKETHKWQRQPTKEGKGYSKKNYQEL